MVDLEQSNGITILQKDTERLNSCPEVSHFKTLIFPHFTPERNPFVLGNLLKLFRPLYTSSEQVKGHYDQVTKGNWFDAGFRAFKRAICYMYLQFKSHSDKGILNWILLLKYEFRTVAESKKKELLLSLHGTG